MSSTPPLPDEPTTPPGTPGTPGAPGAGPASQGPARKPGRAGRWLVILLLALGLLAAVVSVSYWTLVLDRSARGSGASGRPDPEQVQAELEQLQQQVAQALMERQPAPMVPKVAQFVQRYPDYAPARVLYGSLLIRDRQPEEALAQLRKALQLEPRQPDVHRLAGNLCAMMERHSEAEDHYRAAVDLAPGDAHNRVFLAQALTKQRKFDKAQMLLLEALRLDSSLHGAYYALSDLYARNGRLEQALDQAQKAIDTLNQAGPEASGGSGRSPMVSYVRWKANLLRRANRAQESLQTLQALDVVDRRDPGVMEEMAVSWAMLDQPRKGAELFEEALERRPTDWPYAAGAARWRAKAGDQDKARQHLGTVRRLDPTASAIPEIENLLR